MNWYYVDAGQQAGPIDEAQLQELVRTGKIAPETLVWREGMPNWLPYSQVRGGAAPGVAAGPAPAGDTVVCAECGGTFNRQDTIRYGTVNVCAGCKPTFMQKLSEGAQVNTGTMRYAGFWIRFAAKFIDGLILGVFFIPPLIYFAVKSASNPEAAAQFGILQLVVQFFYFAVNAVYTIFFLGKFGATPGKMACKLVVVTAEGSKISWGRATGRFFAEILSGMICYIGYIIAGFDEQKRTLHDHICNTRVIYK